MLFDLLPHLICECLKQYSEQKIYELRLRINCPIVINYGGKNILLENERKESIFATREIIDYVIRKATENSIYAYNNQMKQGFITAKGGIRLGIAGQSVISDDFMPKTLKDICSVNIRVPHQVKGCSIVAFKFIYSKVYGLKNTLIISPPGAGKTTFLRDIACQISKVTDKIYNTLIVDERFEIASVVGGLPMLDVGEFSDIVSGATKKFAFENGIRALRPDVILTDELINEDDAIACENAMMSGVKVIATVHANNLRELEGKKEFKGLLDKGCFERYVVLSNKNGAGTCDGIFDENKTCIYF